MNYPKQIAAGLTKALDNCRFCGSSNVGFDVMSRDETGNPTNVSPECRECGATIIRDEPFTEAEATAAWNRCPSPPTAEVGELVEQALRKAYEQGAHDVHENWQEDRDPDFTEAAGDYVASLDLTWLSAASCGDGVQNLAFGGRLKSLPPAEENEFRQLMDASEPQLWEEVECKHGTFYRQWRFPLDGDVDGDTGQWLTVGGEIVAGFEDSEEGDAAFRLLDFLRRQAIEALTPSEPSPTPSQATVDGDLVERVKAAFLVEMRHRKFLEYLFDEDPGQRGAYGYIDEPFDLAVQSEIQDAIAQAALTATDLPGRLKIAYVEGVSDGWADLATKHPEVEIQKGGSVNEMWRESMTFDAIRNLDQGGGG